MTMKTFDALIEKLSAHIDLSKSRMETLILLIVGMIGSRTVNLSHVASERGSVVQPASTYRKRCICLPVNRGPRQHPLNISATCDLIEVWNCAKYPRGSRFSTAYTSKDIDARTRTLRKRCI